MKLNTDYKVVKVNQKSLGIKDEEFEITVKIMTYKENMALMESFKNDSGDVEILDYAEAVFVKSVVGWKGIEDSNGEDLECNDENKKLIFTFNPDFCQKVIEFASKEIEIIKKK